ncbi:phosphatidate cytidylyltransferase [candidate division KSB1 bacterium]|nr:phosphatidate cytidylyltransferase [candidate division KSB1 bacterium]
MQPLFGSALLWNAVVGVVEVIYIFVVIGIMDKLVTKGFPSDLSRKVIHIAAGSYVIFWPLYDPTHWSKAFCVLMPMIWVLLFLSKGLANNREDQAVKTMTRTGNPRELLRGPLMFALVMVILGLTLFNHMSAVIALGMLTWGDGLAPYFGGKYGKKRYRIWGQYKSYVGSVTVVLAGFIGSLLMIWITGTGTGLAVGLVALLAFVAMIVEAISPRDLDNLLIPGAVLLVYFILAGSL